MPKWTEYTTKDTLADNDEVMLYDATARANKRGLMSKFWDYVVDKMSTAVISKLKTENKTIIGAINYLYGNSAISTQIETFNGEVTLIPPFSEGVCFLNVSVYDAPSNTEQTLYILGYHHSYENCRKERIYGNDFVSEVIFDKSNGALKFTFTLQAMVCRIMFFRNK